MVLSNNDGCDIARTQAGKDLDIETGDPYHLVNKWPELKLVIWKSSNCATEIPFAGQGSTRQPPALDERGA